MAFRSWSFPKGHDKLGGGHMFARQKARVLFVLIHMNHIHRKLAGIALEIQTTYR